MTIPCPYCQTEVSPMRDKVTGYVRRNVIGDAMYDHCNHVFTESTKRESAGIKAQTKIKRGRKTVR